MNKLNLTVRGAAYFRPAVYIDGKAVRCKRNKFGGYEYTYQTNEKTCSVSVLKKLEINGRFWWFFSLLFYFIGIFGIFDVPYDKTCTVLNCEFTVGLSPDTSVAVEINADPAVGGAKISTQAPFQVRANQFYVDPKAKKRLKIMKVVKIIVFLAVVAALVAVAAVQILGGII